MNLTHREIRAFLIGFVIAAVASYCGYEMNKPKHVPATLDPMESDEPHTGALSLKGATVEIQGWYDKDGKKITARDEKLKVIMRKGDSLIKWKPDTTYVDDCMYRNAVYSQLEFGTYEAEKYIKDNPAKDTLWSADMAIIQRVEMEIGTHDGHVIEKYDTIEFTYWFLKDSIENYFHEVEEHFGERSHYMNHK
jgi:hypothetical protein